MNLYPAFVFLVVLSCTDTSPRNERGVPGAPGLNGKNGADGRSCQAQEAKDGIQILCDGQDPFFLSHGKNGMDAVNGKDGVSCQIKSSTAESVILSCPDASTPAGMKEIEVKNGQDGTSCEASRSFGGITIKCGKTEFRLEDGTDGDDGRNGTNGTNGTNGVDGQDNFSTELSEAEIIGDITMGSSFVECSVKIKSNDQNLVKRPFMGYLLHDGKVVSQQRLFSQNRTHEFDRMKFKMNLYRDFMKPLLPLQCRSAVFADREVFDTPIALTSYSVSATKIVQDSPQVLQSAVDFDQTVAALAEGFDTLKVTLNNLKSPSPSSECRAKLSFDADVYNYSTRETRARFDMMDSARFIPTAGENQISFDLTESRSTQVSKVHDVMLFLSCNGDREYKVYMGQSDPFTRSFVVEGTFFPTP